MFFPFFATLFFLIVFKKEYFYGAIFQDVK